MNFFYNFSFFDVADGQPIVLERSAKSLTLDHILKHQHFSFYKIIRDTIIRMFYLNQFGQLTINENLHLCLLSITIWSDFSLICSISFNRFTFNWTIKITFQFEDYFISFYIVWYNHLPIPIENRDKSSFSNLSKFSIGTTYFHNDYKIRFLQNLNFSSLTKIRPSFEISISHKI